MDSPHDKLMALLEAEPKPVTAERVQQLAGTLGAEKGRQFAKWFQSNGSILMERLNG